MAKSQEAELKVLSCDDWGIVCPGNTHFLPGAVWDTGLGAGGRRHPSFKWALPGQRTATLSGRPRMELMPFF